MTGKGSGSALLDFARKKQAVLFAQFSGQAIDYIDELQGAYRTYPGCHALVDSVAAVLCAEIQSSEAKAVGVHEHGIDVVSWLKDPSTRPAAQYLRSAPISYPLIALTQMTNYLIALQCTGCSASEMRSLLKGAAGHSQGVVSALLVAWAADEADLISKAGKIIQYLFWHGARTQQVYNAQASKIAAPEAGKSTPLSTASSSAAGTIFKLRQQRHQQSPDISAKVAAAANAAKFGTGKKALKAYSPMLAVIGLPPQAVQNYAETADRWFKDSGASANSVYATLSLVNGAAASVVSGAPAALQMTAELIRQDCVERGAPGADQSAVPFYRRCPVVILRPLSVSAPFHCEMVREAIALVMADVKRLGLQVRGSELAIPVYSTAAGSQSRQDNLQEYGDSDVMEALVTMQIAQTVNWPSVLANAYTSRNNESTTTHFLDFGPGGAGGAAGLTARVLRSEMGSRACVVVVRPGVTEEEARAQRKGGTGEVTGGAGDDKLPLLGTAALLGTDGSKLQDRLALNNQSSSSSSSSSSSFWPQNTSVVTVSVADDVTTKQRMPGGVTFVTDAS
jgi:malonyl CoA-acyl carrier protein transacylase